MARENPLRRRDRGGAGGDDLGAQPVERLVGAAGDAGAVRNFPAHHAGLLRVELLLVEAAAAGGSVAGLHHAVVVPSHGHHVHLERGPGGADDGPAGLEMARVAWPAGDLAVPPGIAGADAGPHRASALRE